LGLNELFALTLVFPRCKQDPIYVFPVMKLRGLGPHSYIHAPVSDIFPRIGPIMGKDKSLKDS
jgi:hypothetical protein